MRFIKNRTWNSLSLLKKSRKIKKELSSNPALEEGKKKRKIAVLGDYSTQHFSQVLHAMLWEEDISADIYQGEYDGIAMDVLNPESAFYTFQPEITILLCHHSKIHVLPPLFATVDEVNHFIEETLSFYKTLWNAIQTHSKSHIFQSNFMLPLEDALGNLSVNYPFSQKSFLQRVNLSLSDVRPSSVNIIDMDGLSNRIGKERWFHSSGYVLHKLPFHLDYLVDIASLFVGQILALQGQTKKCLVLDLDNTLWGGEVGDCGAEGIELNPNHPLGESFLAFQRYVLALKQRGVILAVCSKNQEDVAKKPFLENPYMVLSLEDISCFVANWEDKASNLSLIAHELNIDLNSFVFFDDNLAEREIVRQFLPQVQVVEVPEDPADYVTALDAASGFEWIQITEEDVGRSDSYQAQQKMKETLPQFVNYQDYLHSLEMKGEVCTITPTEIPRFSQLMNKSNQFNLRTQRYSEGEIRVLTEDTNCRLFGVKLEDKFSNYGMIACVILKKQEDVCFIDTYLMSCRVLKRGIEQFLLPFLVEEGKRLSCTTLVGEYIPTEKNKMVEHFYQELGFSRMEDRKESRFSISLEGDIPTPVSTIQDKNKK